MVTATLFNPQEISAAKLLNIGTALGSKDLLAETLRSELAARLVCTTRALCNKVISTLEPVQETSIDELKEVLAELELNGDVTCGSKGQVAASPLRAIRVGEGRYRLHGSVASRKLIDTFPEMPLSLGLNRLLSSSEDQDSISDKIAKLGGIVLNPERWAGLSKTPRADTEWLSSLDVMLDNDSWKIPAGSLDNGLNDVWQSYKSEAKGKPQNDRWKKSGSEEHGRLWRAWHERGWYLFAWTSGKSPSMNPCIKLNSDHARRTMFAMDRIIGNPVPVSLTREKDRVFFRIAGFLPVAEYRYLSTVGEYTGKQGNYYCFEIPSDLWSKACQITEDRLGIKLKQG
ncbi:MAG: hypothetical protein KJ990_00200 [Proteobacteria bacterium]|nr:hypothetical protein [Pseudomonadota bacterium]MBU1648350.1 hypothetical protein [Pseudomonadota bacterium]